MKRIIQDLSKPVKTIISNRELMIQLVLRNLSVRYKGTIFGFAWNLLQPLFLFLAYSFAFGVVFHSSWTSDLDPHNAEALYAVIMFCGMTVYTIFSETVAMSPNLFVNNPNYIKKVIFPLEILPVAQVFTSIINVLFWLAILLISTFVILKKLSLTMLFLPVILVPYIIIMIGISFVLSSIGVYFRDVSQICSIIAQIGFLVTPICYPAALIPKEYDFIIRLNFVAWYVDEVRNVFIFGKLPNFCTLVIMYGVAILVFYLGYACLNSVKKGFADVL